MSKVVKKAVKKKMLSEEETLLENVIKILEDKKALDIRHYKVAAQTCYTDYFVVCTGTSTTHLRALTAGLHKEMKQYVKEAKETREKESGWQVLDFGMVVVHCMAENERDFYKLDELWEETGPAVYHHY